MITCDVFLPVFAGRMVDAIVSSEAGARPSDAAITGAVAALLTLIALEAVYRILRIATDKVWIRSSTSIMDQIIKDVFFRVQRFSTDWHANNFAGATVRKITRGKWAYDSMADTIYFGLIPTTLIVIGMTVMISLQWLATGLFLGVIFVTYIGGSYILITRYVAPANREFNTRDSKLGAVLADSITCNSVVKAFGAEHREDRTVSETSDRWAFHAMRSWNRGTNTAAAQWGLLLLMLIGLLSISLFFWVNGKATPGQITLVLTTYFVVSNYLRYVGMHMREFQKAVNEMEDLISFMAQPLGVTNEDGAGNLLTSGGAIELNHVTFQYGAHPTPLFDDLSLKVAAGERVALVGRSGSGKTTFVKLVQRLYDIQSGSINIDGRDITDVTQESLRQSIAIVQQDPVLFHRSLKENISYGFPGASQEQIEAAAKRAHADEFICKLPQGYDTLVGERGVKLSGGERQRVAIARAFLADCPILILDEATSSLDSQTELHIQSSMKELMKDRTTIVIAHRLSTIREVDRILVFCEGQIVEQGTHAELMSQRQSHYRGLVDAQELMASDPGDPSDTDELEMAG